MNSNIVLGTLIGLTGITIISIGYTIGTYNRLVQFRQDINNMFSNLGSEYQRRADLFFNLAESVKGYAKFEKETLIKVIEARSGNFGKTPQEKLKNFKKLDGSFASMLGKLNVIFERYPNLKANEQYLKLMNEVRITEDRINIARTDFNGTVNEYNTVVKSFPSNFIANAFKFTLVNYYKNEANVEKAPKLNMGV